MVGITSHGVGTTTSAIPDPPRGGARAATQAPGCRAAELFLHVSDRTGTRTRGGASVASAKWQHLSWLQRHFTIDLNLGRASKPKPHSKSPALKVHNNQAVAIDIAISASVDVAIVSGTAGTFTDVALLFMLWNVTSMRPKHLGRSAPLALQSIPCPPGSWPSCGSPSC